MNPIHVKQVLASLDRIAATPRAITDATKRRQRLIDGVAQMRATPRPATAAAIAAVILDGGDPLTDPAIVAITVAREINTDLVAGDVRKLADELVVRALADSADDVVDAWREPFNAAAEDLVDAHAVLGPIDVNDPAALLTLRGAAPSAWAKARDALATIHEISQDWATLGMDTGRWKPGTPPTAEPQHCRRPTRPHRRVRPMRQRLGRPEATTGMGSSVRRRPAVPPDVHGVPRTREGRACLPRRAGRTREARTPRTSPRPPRDRPLSVEQHPGGGNPRGPASRHSGIGEHLSPDFFHCHAKPAGAAVDATCASCGSTFRATRSTARFCGGTCRQRHHRDRPPVVAPAIAAYTPRPALSISRAAASGKRRDLLVALRMRVAEALDAPNASPRTLLTLSRRLLNITRDIQAIDSGRSDTPDRPLPGRVGARRRAGR